MPNNGAELAELRAKVADLEARLTALTDKHQRDVKALMGCDDILDKHRKVNGAELADAFERIKNLELSVFPGLAAAITDLSRVIGDQETKAYNSLDFRNRSTKLR